LIAAASRWGAAATGKFNQARKNAASTHRIISRLRQKLPKQ
jgi:hypothetical protein